MRFYDMDKLGGAVDITHCVTLPELAELLRPLLQPAPATDARLLAVDKKREVAERALADAQQEIEALRAQLKAIPWDSLELLACSAYIKLPFEVLRWYNANSPYRQEA